jgi:hypothetical protein
MNKVKKRKLGLAQSDAKKVVSEAFDQLDSVAPISKEVQLKDFTKYSTQNLKTINLGTLRNPVEQLAIYDSSVEAYIPIDLQKSKPRFYVQKKYNISLNGEVLNYTTNVNIDQNNPYDPLFASFDRLYSLPLQTFVQSGVTGVRIGEKEKYYSLTSGFGKSSIINITGAGTQLNGAFVPTNQIINGKTRFLNASLAFPADIRWSNSPSGWVMFQTTQRGNLNASLTSVPRYFLNSTGLLPTGNNWTLTGRLATSGLLPAPVSFQKEFEGFFKIATSRQSSRKNKIYATPTENNGLTVGETTGTLPLGASWATYPHTYNVESYTAFRYPVSITMESNNTGITDLVVISTGINQKKIVYVSPHSIEQFQGFWSEQASSNRQPLTGINGKILNARNIWILDSGNLISVSSEYTSFTGLNSVFLSGESGSIGEFYNFNNAVLKQTVPLSQTAFYKLYEPLYRKNGINTGTWNGIIPSGVPFSIETVRTKNSEMRVPKLTVHVAETFVNVSPSGSGLFQFLRPFGYEDLAGFGYFEGYAQANSNISKYQAEYFAITKSKSKAKSKLKGYLWEKGLTIDNSKVRKVVKLFGTPVNNSGVHGDGRRYCLPYENPSDPLSCSYTGHRGIKGIVTSAGLRLVDKNSTVIRNMTDEDGDIIKFTPIVED